MKRDGYNDDGPAMKRQRQPDDEVTFLIPSKVAGSIIGKGGANISKLRNQGGGAWPAATACLVAGARPTPLPRTRRPATQYKASITVPDCPGPERVLAIMANEVETLLEIVKDILPNLADAGPKGGNNSDDLDIRLLIHQSRAGCVIGKGGTKIKELREQTGSRLKIFSNAAPQSTERVVQIVGNSDSVIAAIREVLDLTRQVPIKGPIQNYDPHNYDDFYAEEYGGYGGMSSGRPSRGGPPPAPPAPRRPPPRGAPPPRGPPPMHRSFNEFGPGGPPPPRGNFGGPPRGGFGGGGNFGGGGANFGGGGGGGGGFGGGGGGVGGGFGGGGGGFGGGGGGFGNSGGGGFGGRPGGGGGGGVGGGMRNDDNQQETTTTQVTIPKDLAGAIIGKAGSRIRKIRAESGAGIEIAEPLPGSSERVITITGTPPRIQMAQYLLQQSVHESPNLGGGGGGRGNF